MRFFNKACWLAGAGLLLATAAPVLCQWYPAGRESKLGAMLDEGLVTYQTPELALRLVRSSGTAAALEASDVNPSPNPKAPQARPLRGAKAFDFTPAELLAARSVDGYYHLVDLDVRLAPADAYTPRALLRLEQTARVEGVGSVAPAGKFTMERGAYVVPLNSKPTSLQLESGLSAAR